MIVMVPFRDVWPQEGFAWEADDDCGMTSETPLREREELAANGQARVIGPWFYCMDCRYCVMRRDSDSACVISSEGRLVGQVCDPCNFERRRKRNEAIRLKMQGPSPSAIQKIVKGVGKSA